MEGWGSVCHNGREACTARPKEKCDPSIVPPAQAHPLPLPEQNMLFLAINRRTSLASTSLRNSPLTATCTFFQRSPIIYILMLVKACR